MIKRTYLRKQKRDPHRSEFGYGYVVIIEPLDWRNDWPTEKALEKQIESFTHTLDEFHIKFAPGTFYSFHIGYDDLTNRIFTSLLKTKNTAQQIQKWFVDTFGPSQNNSTKRRKQCVLSA